MLPRSLPIITKAEYEGVPGLPPPSPMISPTAGSELRVIWPVKLVQQQSMGYLIDENGNRYPRDIGVSSKFSNGRIMIQYGDTFSYSSNGTFLGNTDNTASFVTDPQNQPTRSTFYPFTKTNLTSNYGERVVDPFLYKTASEQDTNTTTIKLWSFTGTVEYARTGSAIEGWTFYQKRELKKAGDIDGKYIYTGIARVRSVFRTERTHSRRSSVGDGNSTEEGTSTEPIPLFHANEPLFGDFTAVSDVTPDDEDDEQRFIYVYGHFSNKNKSVLLARAPLKKADIRSEYRYWDGQKYSEHMNKARPVFTDMQHGQIFQTTMFGTKSAYKWAFFGNNSFGDSKAIVGRAKNPEGPWQMEELNMTAYALNKSPGPFRYCFYPHPWAFDIKKEGDMMVTWSEGGMTGNVVAELIRFETTRKELDPIQDNDGTHCRGEDAMKN